MKRPESDHGEGQLSNQRLLPPHLCIYRNWQMHPRNWPWQLLGVTMRRFSRRRFLADSSLLAASTLVASSLPTNMEAQTGAPAGSPDAYAIPKPMIAGPYN